MNVDTEIIVLAMVVMSIASTVQASVGFGAGLLAAPVFAFLDPDLVPGPIFLATGALTVLTSLRERGDIDWPVVGGVTIGRIPGTILGGFVLAAVSDRSLQLMVGLTILVAVFLSSRDIQIRENLPTRIGAGFASGFGATTSAIGGPPLALILQHRSGPALRATMSTVFVIGTAMTLPAIAAAGRLGRDELIVGALLMPGALLGFVLSGPLRRHVDAGRLRSFVLGLSAIAATALIAQAL